MWLVRLEAEFEDFAVGALCPAGACAVFEDSDAGKCEVVFDGVGGFDSGKGLGNPQSGFEGRVLVVMEA